MDISGADNRLEDSDAKLLSYREEQKEDGLDPVAIIGHLKTIKEI